MKKFPYISMNTAKSMYYLNFGVLIIIIVVMTVINSTVNIHPRSQRGEVEVYLESTLNISKTINLTSVDNSIAGLDTTPSARITATALTGKPMEEIPLVTLMERRGEPHQEGPSIDFISPVDYIETSSPNTKIMRILAWSEDTTLLNTLKEGGLRGSCRTPSGYICQLTSDRSLYNESDAVLIKLSHEKGLHTLPQHRFSFQKWVAFEVEAPPRCDIRWPGDPDINYIRYMFNITSTFTPDSTVPTRKDYWAWPYKGIHSVKYRRYKKMNLDYMAGKTRNVAWFVSHCETQSQRENYVKELQKYIDVDIYGKCGNFTCGDSHNREDCDETVVNSTYRYYLSFENSLCQGYVTEKIWRFLSKPISTIPVVYGYTPYKVFLPPQTVIDVSDFKSPKELANRLKNIAKYARVFNEYIVRKLSLKMLPNTEFTTPYICRLCDHLHANRDKMERIPDVKSYWNTKRKCVLPWKLIPGDFWERD